jgi:hypothetical protein
MERNLAFDIFWSDWSIPLHLLLRTVEISSCVLTGYKDGHANFDKLIHTASRTLEPCPPSIIMTFWHPVLLATRCTKFFKIRSTHPHPSERTVLYLHEWRSNIGWYAWNIGIIHHCIDIPYTVYQPFRSILPSVLYVTFGQTAETSFVLSKRPRQSARLKLLPWDRLVKICSVKACLQSSTNCKFNLQNQFTSCAWLDMKIIVQQFNDPEFWIRSLPFEKCIMR